MRNQLILFLLFILSVSCNDRKLNTTMHNQSKYKGQQINDNLVDIDGNVYHTVKIGTQIWMVENLKVSRYCNGDSIYNGNLLFDVPDANTSWRNLKTGAYCNIFYNINGADGRLYNFNAVSDKRSIAPEGWHVPSYIEWKTLIAHLGGSSVAAGKLKEKGTTHWQSPNKGATNESGFAAKPYPTCTGNGAFIGTETHIACWWSTTEDPYADKNIQGILSPAIIYNSTEINFQVVSRMFGISVRCIKDN